MKRALTQQRGRQGWRLSEGVLKSSVQSGTFAVGRGGVAACMCLALNEHAGGMSLVKLA